MNDIKLSIKNAIAGFKANELFENSISLFNTLGYNTARQNRLDNNSYSYFKNAFIDADDNFNEEKALTNDWIKIELLFQLTNEEVTGLTNMFSSGKVDNTIIESYLFFAVELKGTNYSRTKLSAITREINKLFSMPVMLLFFYDEKLTLSVINRRLNKRDSSKDVLEKVTLIKDIRITNPHRAHIEILYDLSFPILTDTFKVTNFVELHRAWEKILDTKELNKKFFGELSNWYFWAINEVEFPDDAENDRNKRNPISVIRLITRLMFVWFIKEKSLVPEQIFDKKYLDTLLNYNDVTGSAYYKAILQNLFFATLNTDMNRDKTGSRKFVNGQYLVHNRYRYGNLFNDKTGALKLFENIPFLNGGLFECLDRKDENDNVIRIDCFSENPKNQKKLKVPDYLFFGEEQIIDLSDAYGNKKKSKEKVRPIIDILNSYKFTIAENTPIEEEVALDPELLGKVFENLLASYNPETKTTARKQTGSFYTPREIVNYMVDESLIAYFITKLLPDSDNTNEKEKEKIEAKLRQLFEYNEQPHQFDNSAVDILINAIDEIKILDPAAGSGAFPMGILHRLVFLLHKLDPHNEKWKQKQIDKISEIEDPTVREQLLTDVEESFTNNELDYGRKLYLIENCIYGIDIQPVAVQIAKLRFFISLVADQKVNHEKKNFGIRPLPNLETKFVAANTLIGLEKEEDNLFTNPNIEDIKKQLKNVRHRYFTARTHKTKEKYRKKDKELRQKLSELLTKEHYLQPEDAKMLAKWDPYDQNASSPFFDPEWMFGITNGFDVVIGNPPYASAVTMARSQIIKTIYKKLYPLATGSYDIYILFLYKTIELLNNNGIYSWIIPNKFLIADYADKTKLFLIKNGLSLALDVSSFNVFENTSVYPIVIVGNKSNFSIEFKEYLLDNYTDLKKRIFKEPLKLSEHKQIKDFNIKIGSGTTGFEAKKVKNLLSNTYKANTIPFTVSGGINRYSISNENIRFMGLKLNKAFVRNSNTIAKSKWIFWNSPKIIVAGMTREIESVYVQSPYGLGVGVYAIYNFGGFDPFFLTGILNSVYLTFYIKNKFKDKHLAGGYLAINKSTLEKLPLEKSQNEQAYIILSKILHNISLETNIIANNIKNVLDAMVFELYFPAHMKERKIDILKYVEEDINQVMQGREFEHFTDTEKEEVIEKLHKKWTAPDSIVRNRIKQMPIKSPDIIKPILESK